MTSVVELLSYLTLIVDNEWGGIGTGFLVGRAIDESHSQIFVVTNKHVLGDTEQLRQDAEQISFHLNVSNDDGRLFPETVTMPLRYDNTHEPLWREHNDSNVDVAAINVTPLLAQIPQINRKWLAYQHFVDVESFQKSGLAIGSDVLVFGYPKGLRQGSTNLPIVRAGLLATRLGEALNFQVEKNGRQIVETKRGFLVDGGAIPGSSGSPIFSRPSVMQGSRVVMPPPEPKLLGILAETITSPLPENKYQEGFAGLGIAHDADTIKETIELFYQ